MSTKGDVTGDFSSRYKTVMTTKMTGANVPAMMQTARTSTADLESSQLNRPPFSVG